MTSIFDHSDYRRAFNFLVKSYTGESRGLQTRLAEFIGCQQAYVSRVLSGKAEFSQEQAYALTNFFNLDTLEQEYFLTLVCLNRAGSSDLKRYYEKRRSEILARKLEIKSRIKVDGNLSDERKTIYYSDWVYAAAHIAVAVERFATRSAIATRLGISEHRVKEVLEFLEDSDLIEKKTNHYLSKTAAIHLGNDPSLLKAHHTNWRLRAIASLSCHRPAALNYSSVISCGSNDSVRIREIMLKAIQEIRGVVRSSPNEQLYCYNLDFFEV